MKIGSAPQMELAGESAGSSATSAAPKPHTGSLEQTFESAEAAVAAASKGAATLVITRWDLERLDPSYTADIEAERLSADLTERQGMEGFSEGDSDEAQVASG